MASIYNSRKFNLIPPLTKEEEGVIKERDNSFFYSFILIFCAIVVFAFLTLAQVLIIQPKVASENQNLDDIKTQITSFDSLKKVHGELFIKSQSLDSILVQDIKLTQLLDISEQLSTGIPNGLVTQYSRLTTGEFVIAMKMDDITDTNTIFTNSQKISVLKGFNLKSVTKGEATGQPYYLASVGFFITNITNGSQ